MDIRHLVCPFAIPPAGDGGDARRRQNQRLGQLCRPASHGNKTHKRIRRCAFAIDLACCCSFRPQNAPVLSLIPVLSFTPSSRLGAAVLAAERSGDPCVYAIGGFSDAGQPTNRVDVLSNMTQMWEESAPLHQARGFHASCVHENRVFVAGARIPDLPESGLI